jgi:aspartate aminotransferase
LTDKALGQFDIAFLDIDMGAYSGLELARHIRSLNLDTILILGFVNAPTLQQKLVKYCLEEKTDISYYDRNREVLYQGLRNLGFSCIKPEGAFYLFMKSPVADEKQFCEAAKKYHILIVPGSSFACPGYVRLAYCVSYETIINSLPEFAKLAAEYGLKAAE